MVRAKFRVDSISPKDDQGCATIALSPVYDSNPESENGKFFRYTPSGQISLGTVNANAVDEFEVGGEFFVDFTRAAPIADGPTPEELAGGFRWLIQNGVRTKQLGYAPTGTNADGSNVNDPNHPNIMPAVPANMQEGARVQYKNPDASNRGVWIVESVGDGIMTIRREDNANERRGASVGELEALATNGE